MVRCGNDDSFGPVLTAGPGCYEFDFTLVFEDSIFSIAPCGLVILLAAWRLHRLIGRPTVVQWPLLRALKLVCGGANARQRPGKDAARGLT